MTAHNIIWWLIVGGIAGWLAGKVLGEAHGIVGDLIVGVVGAFLGGWLFHEAELSMPIRGLPGTIAVAFVGAVVLLLALRLVARLRGGRALFRR
jgi:uncharacterized membrane protein YeaQ/YmgE (transglycosylase-associated protein family)